MFNRLRGRIVEKYGHIYAFAADMETTSSRISKLLCHKSDWSREEVLKAAELLDIESAQIGYFFYPEVP